MDKEDGSLHRPTVGTIEGTSCLLPARTLRYTDSSTHPLSLLLRPNEHVAAAVISTRNAQSADSLPASSVSRDGCRTAFGLAAVRVMQQCGLKQERSNRRLSISFFTLLNVCRENNSLRTWKIPGTLRSV